MIYLDHAATTPMRRQVCEAMWPFMISLYGNPSGIYDFAAMNKQEIEQAREVIAATIGAKAQEIFFTSGGTESDNWVLKSKMLEQRSGHMIVSSIEHHAVIHTCMYLEKLGFKVSYVKVRPNGMIDVDELERCIRKDTVLISVMLVNNEIGTIQPIRKICSIAKKYGIPVHTDAVAAYGHIPIDVNELGVSYLSVSAHKICGPKGVGFLYARDGKIAPFLHGGGQERGERAGTENVCGIVGMKVAADIAVRTMPNRMKREREIRDYMISRILREIPDTRLNGDREKRVSGNMNFSFAGVDGAALIVMLDKQGICASAGSACSSGSGKPSHVLTAIGLPDNMANASVRFTIDDRLTIREAGYYIECLKRNVAKLRALGE